MVIGDFNEILFHYKKSGDQQKNEKLMQDFWDALEKCSFSNLGHVNNFFIWSNKHETETFTK